MLFALVGGIVAAAAIIFWALRPPRDENAGLQRAQVVVEEGSEENLVPIPTPTAPSEPIPLEDDGLLDLLPEMPEPRMPTETDFKRVAYVERIERESIEEALDAYMEEGLSKLYLPFLASGAGYFSLDQYAHRASLDPRLARLFRFAREGTPEERRRVLERAAAIFERELDAEERGEKTITIWSEGEGKVLIMLIAESTYDGSLAVPLILRAFHMGQVQLQKMGKDGRPMNDGPILFTRDVDIQLWSLRGILDLFCDNPELRRRLRREQSRVMDEYGAYRDGAAVDGRGRRMLENTRIVDFAERTWS